MSRQKLTKNRKVCYVLSYKAPDYVRTRVLLEALKNVPATEIFTAVNESKSTIRYFQTLGQLLKTRIIYRPDIYILGFRGQEIFWPVRLLTIGKPLIFDEFINPHDWLGEENAKLPKPLLKFADIYESWALGASRLVLSDTKLGAKKSSETYKIRPDKFRTIYVGTDETVFKPRKSAPKNKLLEVFFYGNMAPLHGLDVILEAAASLRDQPVHFTIVGGKGRRGEAEQTRDFIRQNDLSNITHKDWLDFSELPAQMAKSDLFLGGPFGNTSQARRVITGKTFQALAVGVPAIVGKIDEEVGFKNEENCLLVNQGSAIELTATISWSMENRNKLNSIGRNGRRLFEERFSKSIVCEQLRNIINEVQEK